MIFRLALAIILVSFPGCAASPLPTPTVVEQHSLRTALDLMGKSVDLQSYKGRPVILHFWAPWCFVCGPEMKSLAHLHKNISDLDVTILGVSTGDTLERTREYVKKNQIPFPVVVDTEGVIIKEFSTQGIPLTVILDSNGEQVAFPDPQDGKETLIIEGPRGWESQRVLRALEKLR